MGRQSIRIVKGEGGKENERYGEARAECMKGINVVITPLREFPRTCVKIILNGISQFML